MCPIFYNCQVLNCQSLLKYNTLNPMLWLSCKHFSLLSLQFHSFHLFIHSVNSIQSFNHSLTQFIYTSYIISYLYEACSSFSCYLVRVIQFLFSLFLDTIVAKIFMSWFPSLGGNHYCFTKLKTVKKDTTKIMCM